MKLKHTKPLTMLPIAVAALAFAACDIDKTEDGELPEVKIEGETKLPKYEVEGPDVKVEKKKIEMEVPTVDIDLPEEEDKPGQPATDPGDTTEDE